MKTIVRWSLLLVLLVAGLSSAAAQSTVRGRVVSAADQSPLAGVTVRLQGTTQGVVTDADGRYTLPVPAGTTALVFARPGYATQAVTINGRSEINVSLQTSAVQLQELVVVGYTTQARRTVADAVTSVSADQIEDRQVATVEEALRGRVAGVNIVSSGEPGRSSSVIVRGQNFLSAADPLYVVDGMYTRQNPNLNPEDIESVEVLKDASAAAQYGAQSANGVIVIRTKRGRTGAPRVQLNSYYGFQDVPNQLEMMGTEQWLAYAREARRNAADPNIRATADLPFQAQFNTDWQDAVFQSGAIQDHNLTISGGNESASYLLSAGYLDQVGTVMNTGFERYSVRVNSEMRRGRLRVGQNAAFARSLRDNVVGFPLIDAVILTPVVGVRDPNNASGYGFGAGRDTDFSATFGTNPVGAFEREDNQDISNRVLGNLYGEIDLFGGLRYRLNVGIDYEDLNWRWFQRVRQIRQNTIQPYNEGRDRRDNTVNLLAENLLFWDASRGEHDINAVAGITEQKNRFRRVEAYGTTFLNENITEIGAATANLNNDAFTFPSSLRGYLARASYSYAGKYLLTGTFRRDGSSRFGPGNRWADFFSGSVGYVLSEEDFYQSVPLLGSAVDYLKLRASYGSLGNQDIGDFQYAASIVTGLAYPFGGGLQTGATQVALATPDIRWQDQTQVNVGLDFALLDRALELTADYYVSESDGLLVRAPIPWSLGAAGAPFVNAGSVRNRGFEFSGRYTLERGDLRLSAGANLTTIKNEVTALGNGGQPIFEGFAGVSRTTVGGSIGEFFVVRTDGIFQSEAEVQAHTTTLPNGTVKVIQPNAKPGDIRYRDIAGPDNGPPDGVIDEWDRQVAGSPIPELEGGFTLDAGWRGFDLGLALRGSFGAEVFNVARYWNERSDENHNFRADYRPWTPQNPSNENPRLVFGPEGAANARTNSDRWLEDGSYLRVQNLVLGYELPERFAQTLRLPLQRARVYLNVQNLYTFTGYSNWDPEVRSFDNPLSRGIDDGRIYPNPRTVSIGVDLNL